MSKNSEDQFAGMAEKVGAEGVIEELCKGFRSLMDSDRGVITFESLKREAASLHLDYMTDDDLRGMMKEGDSDGDGALSELEFCVLMFRLSPALMDLAQVLHGVLPNFPAYYQRDDVVETIPDFMGEGLADYKGKGIAHYVGEMMALEDSSDGKINVFGSRNIHHDAENGLNETSEKEHGKGIRPAFQENRPQNTMMVDTRLQLGVSWLTPRPNKQSRSATDERCCSVSSCASNSPILQLATVASAADHEHILEGLDTLNNHGGSGLPPSAYRNMNKSHLNTSSENVQESATTTLHQVSTHGSFVGPSPLVVKGTYKGETFRLEFCYTPCVDELKKEVGEKLELEFGKFKMEFRDEDGEWVVMKDDSDLKHCLRLSRSSDSEIVRLKLLISDIVC